MILTFSLSGHPELLVSKVLDILDLINRRMDDIEATHGEAEKETP